MIEIMLVTENEVRRLNEWGEWDVVALADGQGYYFDEWTNKLMERGYKVVHTFRDSRNLFTLRMEKSR